jgi:hypothetical protein
MHSFIIHIGATAALLLPSVISAQSLPQVDLGYEIHQASSFNVCTLLVTSTKHACVKLDRQLDNFTTFPTYDTPNHRLVI